MHNDNTFNNMIGGAYSKGEHQVKVIDEAHKAYGQGTSKQFYSELFKNQNFDIVDLELQEQFRNGGDALYIDWLNNWIFNEDNVQEWYVNNTYDFDVLDDITFNNRYRELYNKHDVRMSSFWTQKWNAEFDENDKPKRLIKVGSSNYIWNPNNYWIKSFQQNNPDDKVPKWFINDVVNKNFNIEKKGYEYIAYFNTIQGSEFDYIFVHIPNLFFLNKNNELDVDLSKLDYTDMKTQIRMAKGLPNKEKEELNKLYFKWRVLI